MLFLWKLFNVNQRKNCEMEITSLFLKYLHFYLLIIEIEWAQIYICLYLLKYKIFFATANIVAHWKSKAKKNTLILSYKYSHKLMMEI